MFEQATPSQARRGAAFARPLPKAASSENNKAPDSRRELHSCMNYLFSKIFSGYYWHTLNFAFLPLIRSVTFGFENLVM